VFSCVHTGGGITIFSLFDCHILDIRQISNWTKKIKSTGLNYYVSLKTLKFYNSAFSNFSVQLRKKYYSKPVTGLCQQGQLELSC